MSFGFFAFNPFLARQRALAELAVNQVEKTLALRFELQRTYSEMAVEGLRSMLAASDAAAVQEYLQTQPARASALMNQLRGDVERVGELNKAYLTELQALMSAAGASTSAEPVRADSKAAA